MSFLYMNAFHFILQVKFSIIYSQHYFSFQCTFNCRPYVDIIKRRYCTFYSLYVLIVIYRLQCTRDIPGSYITVTRDIYMHLFFHIDCPVYRE